MHLEKSSTQKIDRRNHYLEDKRKKHSGADVITEESFVLFLRNKNAYCSLLLNLEKG